MAEDWSNFYKAVYDQDFQSESYGWIQWKGTGACIDLHCKCGYHGHVDDEFFYFYECPSCKARYALGQCVKLIPLTEEQAAYVASEKTVGFKSDTMWAARVLDAADRVARETKQ